jgi:hypothetical protein
VTRETAESAGTAPWLPPCQAPGNGADVTGLARMTRRARTRLGRYRRRPAGAGGTTGDSGGRWRGRGPGGGPGE